MANNTEICAARWALEAWEAVYLADMLQYYLIGPVRPVSVQAISIPKCHLFR